MFGIILLAILALLQFLVFWEYRKFLNSNLSIFKFQITKLSRRVRRTLLVFPFVFFNLPYIYAFTNKFDFTPLPHWVNLLFIKPFFIFQSSVIIIGLLTLAIKLAKRPFLLINFLGKKFSFYREKLDSIKSKKSYKKFDISRRRFIRYTAAAGATYAVGASALGVYNKDNYELTHRTLSIPNLPVELKGTNVVLISDIHSSPFMLEGKMREYADIINELNADVILISGDLTNSNKTEVHPFNKAFRDLKSKHGIYATLGNHDYFSDENYIAEAVANESPIKMLRNASEMISINNKFLCVHGLEDTRASGAVYDPVILNNFYTTLKKSEDLAASKGQNIYTTPQIMLCHKPYFFDEMSQYFKGLIVSGHTHGGQIVIAELGKLNVSIAGMVSKYLKGLYEKNGSKLYITRGIGTVGLPIRLNCPPEITKITLV